MIQSPDGNNPKNAQKGTGNNSSANAQLDKRRQTIGSPPGGTLQKKSDSKSSEYKLSAPGSITNSSTQQ